MKNKLLIIALLLIATLAVCFFLGCGEDGTGSDTDKNIGNGDGTATFTASVYCADYSSSVNFTFTVGERGYVYFADTNYVFSGYYTEKNGGGVKATDEAGQMTESFAASIEKGKTYFLYPLVEVRTYTVNFVSNCAESFSSEQHKATDEYNLPTLTKKGYFFQGWSSNKNDWTGSTNVYSGQFKENVTLYGIFRAKEYTVYYYCQDKKGYMTVNFGADYTVAYQKLDGYNFNGYYTEKDGGGVKLTDSDGKSLSAWDIVPEGSNVPNIYGLYTSADVYTLTYPNDGLIDKICVTYADCGGASESLAFDINEYYSNGAKIEYKVPYYNKMGYWFYGWCTDSGCKTDFDFSKDVTRDLTLYPKFKEISGYDSNKTHVSLSSATYEKTLKLVYNYSRYAYYVFDCVGEVTLSYKLSESALSTFSVQNLTENKSIFYSDTVTNTTAQSFSFTAVRGSVISIGGMRKQNGEDIAVNYTFSGNTACTSESKAVTPTEFKQKVTLGNSFILPVYVKGGMTFVGYFTERNGCGTKLTDSEGKSLANWSIGADTTVYAFYR